MKIAILSGGVTTIDLGQILVGSGSSLPQGQEGDVLTYGPGGVPRAAPLPDGTLPPGQEGQVVSYGPEGQPVAVDPFAGIDLVLLFENQLV